MQRFITTSLKGLMYGALVFFSTLAYLFGAAGAGEHKVTSGSILPTASVAHADVPVTGGGEGGVGDVGVGDVGEGAGGGDGDCGGEGEGDCGM